LFFRAASAIGIVSGLVLLVIGIRIGQRQQ